jgi:hypothetical protein
VLPWIYLQVIFLPSQLGLIEKVEKQIMLVDFDFMSYLGDQLSLSIGPIVQMLI